MVGIPRSRGCLLCVQRRVKCDERRPGCQRCKTYGRPCPGYDRGFKFVPGKPYRAQRCRRAGTASARSHIQETSQKAYQPLIEHTNQSSLQHIQQSISILIGDFSTPSSSTSSHIVTRWFGFFPAVYGRNKTLDATIRSFTAHHLGSATGNKQIIHYGKTAYVEALHRLQRSLNNPTECVSSDIFCAVILSCLYELFSNTQDSESWMKHAKGLSRLAEFRGRDCYRNEFDSILLKASRGIIIMNSVFSGQECFLASESWHLVMKEHCDTSLPAGLGYLIEEFIVYFTFAPSFIHKLYALKQADPASPETWVQMSETLKRTLDMLERLNVWYERYSRIAPSPRETISPSDDRIYPMVLSYSDPTNASVFCGYYSYAVIIHEILKACGYPGEHDAMVVYFRDQICKSVEYNGKGLLGPYQMAFPLRVAFEIADPVVKLWLRGWLIRLSNIYPALQPQRFD